MITHEFLGYTTMTGDDLTHIGLVYQLSNGLKQARPACARLSSRFTRKSPPILDEVPLARITCNRCLSHNRPGLKK